MTTPNTLNTPSTQKILMMGSMTSLCEMFLGGHYLETVKIQKQITNKSYTSIIKNLWEMDKLKCFHRGFYPWGHDTNDKRISFILCSIYNAECFK